MKITIDSHTPSNTGVNTQHPALHNSLVQYVCLFPYAYGKFEYAVYTFNRSLNSGTQLSQFSQEMESS